MKSTPSIGIRACLLAAGLLLAAPSLALAADFEAPELPAACNAKRSAVANPASPTDLIRARQALKEGESLLRIDLDSDSRPEAIALEVSAGSAALDRNAIKAVAGWVFKPSANQAIYLPIRFERSPAMPRLRQDRTAMPKQSIAAILDELCADARTHVTRLPGETMLKLDGTTWWVSSTDAGAGRLLVRTRTDRDKRGRLTTWAAHACEGERRACSEALKRRHPDLR